MATDTVKDYLGHPSELAQAFERFADPVSTARKIAANEPREIARQIGIAINRISDRVSHAHDASSAVCECLRDNDDAEAAVALLKMSSEYQCVTSNEFYRFAGIVLVALEQANMVGDAVEVAHG